MRYTKASGGRRQQIILLLLLLCQLAMADHAVAQNIDSLSRLLEGRLPDTQRTTILLHLCRAYADKSDTPQAYLYCTQADALAEKATDTAAQIRANYLLATAYVRGMVDTARLAEFANRALQLSQAYRDTMWIGQSSMITGATWLQRLSLRLEAKQGVGDLPERTIRHFTTAAEMFESKHNALKTANAWAKVGDVYNLLSMPQKALVYYQKLLAVAEQAGNEGMIMTANIQIGSALFEDHEQDSRRKAIPYLEKGKQLAESMDRPYEASYCLDLLAKVYAGLHQYEQAYTYHEAFFALRERMLNEEKISRIAELETQYKTEKEVAEITRQKLSLEQKTNQTNRMLIGVILLLLLSTAFFQYQRHQQKIREKNAELQAQKQTVEAEKLRELDQFKTRFFTNISHEFRTPLTAILGNAELLENKTPSAIEKNNWIQSIKRNGQGLLHLINQILDLAKLTDSSLKLHYQQGNIAAFARYVAESLHSLANAQNVLIQVQNTPSDLRMDYDPERLGQVLQNLLANAIKFTPSGGTVTVSVQSYNPASAPEYVEISVEDTGVGIAPDDLPHIFDRFFQAYNRHPDGAVGSGIGLSLSKELVQWMGGKIGATSTPGIGSRFWLHLPVTRQAPLENSIRREPMTPPVLPANLVLPPESGTPGDRPRLLLVEDNPDVVAYLRDSLAGAYQLEFAYNGRAGLEQAFESSPDLLITDVMMPEKDGFEVCDTLKNDLRTSHIPVVLLTARAGAEDRIAGLRRGADAYLAKPFNPEELHAVIENLLTLRRKLRQYYAGFSLGEAPEPLSIEDSSLEQQFLQQIRAYAEKNIANPDLSAEDLCREAGMSRTNLNLKMNALTGMSSMQYVRQLRLQRARTLLETGRFNVSEVAWETGFNDPKYFSRVFSETFGKPPSEWP